MVSGSTQKIIGLNLKDDDSTLDTCHTPFSKNMPNVNREKEVDDVHANHNDHDEGELNNII